MNEHWKDDRFRTTSLLSWVWPEWRNGRRSGFKIRFPLRECGFKSLLRHFLGRGIDLDSKRAIMPGGVESHPLLKQDLFHL